MPSAGVEPKGEALPCSAPPWSGAPVALAVWLSRGPTATMPTRPLAWGGGACRQRSRCGPRRGEAKPTNERRTFGGAVRPPRQKGWAPMSRRLVLLGLTGLLALGIAALPAAATPAPQLTTIRIGTPAIVVSQWPFLMALARGTFSQANLDIDLSATRTEPLSMQYLVSNSIDLTILSPGTVF